LFPEAVVLTTCPLNGASRANISFVGEYLSVKVVLTSPTLHIIIFTSSTTTTATATAATMFILSL
jgi:hypothetical protein